MSPERLLLGSFELCFLAVVEVVFVGILSSKPQNVGQSGLLREVHTENIDHVAFLALRFAGVAEQNGPRAVEIAHASQRSRGVSLAWASVRECHPSPLHDPSVNAQCLRWSESTRTANQYRAARRKKHAQQPEKNA
jgi:hypothetical protein